MEKNNKDKRLFWRLRGGLAQTGQRIGRFIKGHKKLCAVLALIVVGGGFFAVRLGLSRPQQMVQTAGLTRTVTLQRSSLEDAISATGTVESGSVSNVTTTLKYPVAQVLVQVGDVVSEGDVICVLDSSELEEQIEKEKQNLADTLEQAQSNYDKALTSYNTASDQAAQAESTYSAAQSSYNTALANFEKAQSTVSALQSAYDTAKAKADSAASDIAAKLNAYTAAQTTGTGVEQALAALNAANQIYEGCDWGGVATGGLKAEAEAALAALNSGKELCGYSELEQALNTAAQTMQQARTQLDTAESQYTTAKEQLESAEEALSNSASSDSLEELQSQLEDCTLKATSSGTITALNATVGSAVTDSAVATIQDTEALKIAITVEDYDIASLQVGLPATITSDVTGDTQISGTLSQISKTASTGQSGSSGGFSCEVTVDDADTGLLIGVNAKVEIYLSVTEDVFTVPIDAVGTDEAGNSVIYVQTGEGANAVFEPITVTTGAENDYYIEISSDELEEGMVVRASADPDEATIGSSGEEDASTTDSGLNFSFGNMTGGGTMPSGVVEAPSGGEMPGGMGGGRMGG